MTAEARESEPNFFIENEFERNIGKGVYRNLGSAR